MLAGEKVFIRPIEPEDLPYIKVWRNDGELVRYIWPGVPNPTPLEKLQRWYDELLDDTSQKLFLICTVEESKRIGIVGIHNIAVRSRKGNLSILVGEKDYLGKGYGTEAVTLFLGYVFRVLNLRRVALEVYEYNERAIKAYEKVGFQKEGYVRRSIFKDGQYWGEYIMAIFKDDYYQMYPFQRSY